MGNVLLALTKGGSSTEGRVFFSGTFSVTFFVAVAVVVGAVASSSVVVASVVVTASSSCSLSLASEQVFRQT